jgi:peptidyl-tRNA hydrolase, PTH1 family
MKRLIVGLGNPGKKYEATRHNIGFMVVREVVKRLEGKWSHSSCTQGMTAAVNGDGKMVYFLLPSTFMNLSGIAVKAAMHKYGMDLSDLLIVCDDLDLEFGRLRLRAKGSAGGHNGLRSIADSLGTTEFGRLKIGIGHPGHKDAVIDYVLEGFTSAEKKSLDAVIREAADCCFVWLRKGTAPAMDQYNGKAE